MLYIAVFPVKLGYVHHCPSSPRILVKPVSRNLSDPRPAYQLVADELRQAIAENRLPPGAKLPSERELAQQHGIAQMTARQAIALLRSEGLVDAFQGRGVFVRARPSLRRLGTERYARVRRLRGETPFMADTAAIGGPRFEMRSF